MTIVYDPLTYRTVVARPGEIPYKFWSVNKHVIDAASAGICTLHSGDEAPGDTSRLWLDLTMPENAVGAVKAYDGASWVALTPALFYSHIAGGAGGFVTDLEMATYVSGLIGVSLQAWGENLDQWSALDPTAKEDTGVAATLDAAHLAAVDPHPQYLTAAEGAAAYQPLDSDLTAIAALTTTAYGRAFLALADAAAGRTALGLGTLATQNGTFSGTSSGTNTGDQTITLTGDVTGSGTGSFAATLATVNANTGSWGLAGSVAQFVVNAKGLITSAANVAISIASTAISDATAAGRSMLTAANAAAQTALLSAFVGDSGAGGTKGLVPAPIAGDATKFLKGDGTFASIPGGGDALTANPLSQFAATTSLQLKNTISDETGSGALVFATSPTLVTPALGTPSALVLTNATALPASALVASTSQAVGFGSIELGHATDTTISRVSAGQIAVEGVNVVTTSSTDTLTNKTLTTPIIGTVVGGTTASSPLVLKSTSGVGTSDYVSVVVGNNGATEAARFFTNGNMAINGGSIRTGALISTGDMQVELGGDRTGSGNVYMDFHATSGADYDARFLRGGGTNGTCSFNHKGTGKFIFGNEGAADMEFQTNAVQRLLIDSSGNHYFPGASTTAAGANAYLWTGSSPANLLQRSTSSSVYKRDIEPLENNLGDLLLQMRPVWYRSKCENDNPNWSWYGLIAEEVAKVEPRLVSWGYQDESWEVVQTPIPKMESDQGEQKFSASRQLKADAKLVPDGVSYDRLTVLLIDLVQRLEARIAALEAASANQP